MSRSSKLQSPETGAEWQRQTVFSIYKSVKMILELFFLGEIVG